MIGIKAIAAYLPAQRISNLDRKEAFAISEEFIERRIGMKRLAVCGPGEGTTALGTRALEGLAAKGIDLAGVQALIVVTQNPDRNIPHASAEMHGRLGLNADCACFDISLGCSGYVYALSAASAFMEANGLSAGVVVTADPYSRILDPEDKNTCLLFGDGATATLLGRDPVFTLGKFTFGTAGKEADALACNAGRLHMNGRAVFNFAARYVPLDVAKVLERNGLRLEDVDAFVFHQGSRNIVDTIAQRLALPAEKVRFCAADYGNTVSSSIPMILADEMSRCAVRTILVSGFGVGFSWSSTILKRNS
ncbi:MAG: ketoacyl-ACP synthase III [Burkholderiales bacterium]